MADGWQGSANVTVKAMLLSILTRMLSLFTRTETSLGEFWGSTMLIAMGVWLLLPMSTFSVIPAYRFMGTVAPEPVWGIASLGLGLFQSAGNISKVRRMRSTGSFVASVLFGFVAALAIISQPESLLAPICGTASFVEGVIYLRLSVFKTEAPGGLS